MRDRNHEEMSDAVGAGRTVLDKSMLEKIIGGQWEVKSLKPAPVSTVQLAESQPRTQPIAPAPASLDNAITALGDGIAAAWHQHNYDERIFPVLAEEALNRAAAHETWNVESLSSWLMESDRVPQQVSSPNFGQPPITLYVGHKFYIEALVWQEGTTAVHQHIFNGAFTVLQGSSLHSHFVFDEQDRVCDQLSLGQLSWQSSRLMRPGDIHQINIGPVYIHSLFHLDHPSVTLVVRSYNTAAGAQYEYFAPSVAADPFYHPQPLKVRLRALEALRAIDPKAFMRMAESLVADADLWTVWRVLRMTAEKGAGAHFSHLASVARRRHPGARIDALVTATVGRTRQLQIVKLRQSVRDPGHRFFLALLLNVPDRDKILDLIATQYPTVDAADQAVTWLSEIAATGALNLNLTPVALAMLRMSLEKASFPDVLTTLRQVAPEPEVDAQQGQWRQVWDELHRLPLLSALTAAGGHSA